MTKGLWQGLVGAWALTVAGVGESSATEPVRLGVAGLTHTHVHWIFESAKRRDDFEIVGIAESDPALAERYAAQHGFDLSLVYDDLDTMLAETRPDGVTAFGTIRDHLAVVQAAAPRGIHVMVEKPLAVSLEQAQAMAELAQAHDIHLLTNYETSWYASHHEAVERVRAGEIGTLRKAVFHHGHAGPVALDINSEFLDWLIDPHWNGAGALTDFGCYGANLAVWMTDGRRPRAVTAVTQQLQPEHYPLVDDEATIVIAWDDMQAIVQASWNWPRSRKDMALYGTRGQFLAPDGARLTALPADGETGADDAERSLPVPALAAPEDDPFSWFSAVIRGDLEPAPWSPGALDNNLLVMEILQSAMDSAARGETVVLEP
ncbi:MAG: Gfo/Idh/MocA family oxidoreductase [Pseudomonadota bacterium]